MLILKNDLHKRLVAGYFRFNALKLRKVNNVGVKMHFNLYHTISKYNSKQNYCENDVFVIERFVHFKVATKTRCVCEAQSHAPATANFQICDIDI